jgi:RNA 2',3'-cyclic 3'-phosphodiesterase
MAEQKRVFIAVDISDEARRKITAYIENIKRLMPQTKIKWERSDKLHLTLKFLGDVDAERLPALENAVRTVASLHSPFNISVEGTGVFPGLKDPRILWIGIKGDQLTEIAGELDAACEPLGFEGEKRAFHPHLTIARVRDSRQSSEAVDAHLQNGFGPISFPVTQIAVYESQLLRTGSVYSMVSKHELRGG